MAPFVFGWGFPYKPTHPKRNETPCFFLFPPSQKKYIDDSNDHSNDFTHGKEHSLDDAFNNRIEVEEVADDKMSYYSAQEMGKARQVERMQRSHYLGVELFFLEKEVDDGWERKSHLSTDVL